MKVLPPFSLFLGLCCLGLPSAPAADSPVEKQTWADALAAISLPREPKPGTEKYGYTYVYQFSPQWPSFQGWWRVVKQGTTPVWFDANHDGKRDPNEIQQVRYYLYYYLSGASAEAYDPAERLDAQGFYPWAKLHFDQLPGNRPVEGLGQAAKFIARDLAHNVYYHQCNVLAGPACLQVSLSVTLVTEKGSSSNLLSTEPNWVKDTTDTFPERDALIAMLKSCHADAEAEACRVAGEMTAAWTRWSEQKIAGGSGLKGVFVFSPGWYPQPKEVPADLVLEGSASSPTYVAKVSQARQEGDKKWSATREDRYQFRVAETGSWHGRLESVVTEPVDAARRSFQREIDNLKRNATQAGTGAVFKGPEPMMLAGADEAIRAKRESKSPGAVGPYSYYNRGDVIVFRKDNVVGVIEGTSSAHGMAVPDGGLQPLPHTEALAAQMLRNIIASGQAADGGYVTLSLTATPAALWADGSTQSTLRLQAADESGKPVSAEFQLEAQGGGSVTSARVRTNAEGNAEVTYTASKRPGASTVIASGRKAIASAQITEGGLVLAQNDPAQLFVYADGKSTMTVIVTCTDPAGQPIAGATVKLAVDEHDVPVKGSLAPTTLQTDASGRAEAVYSAPVIDASQGFRAGNVFLTAVAALGSPAKEFKDTSRFQIYAGEVAFVEVSKDGYTAPARFPVQLPEKNATIKGALAAAGFNGATHNVAYAAVRVVDAAGKGASAVTSNEDGTFSVHYTGDPMSSREAAVAMPEPLVLTLNADLQNRLDEGRAALKHLAATGHDVSAATGYLSRFPEQLAKSKPGHADPLHSTEYAINVMPRVAWMSLYTKLANDRQTESANWLIESMEPVIKQLSDLLGAIDDLEKTAKEKLGAQFNASVWQNLKETTAGRFLRQLNVWHRKNTKPLRKIYKAGEKLKGEEVDGDKGLIGNAQDYLKPLVEPLDYAKDKLQEETGTDDLAKKFRTYLKAAMTALLRDNTDTPLRENRQAVLQACAEQAAAGRAPAGAYQAAADRAKELFTTFEKEHHALNLANLDRELYRLDANLFMNTVVKGVFIYNSTASFFSKDTLASIRAFDVDKLTKMQEAATASNDTVGKAADTLDSAFGLYKGKAWLDDLNNSEMVLGKLAETLFPGALPPESN